MHQVRALPLLCLPLSAGDIGVSAMAAELCWDVGGLAWPELQRASPCPHPSHLPAQPQLQDGLRAVEALLS